MLTLTNGSILTTITVALLTTGCWDDDQTVDDEPVVLVVTEQGWNSWREEQPEPATTEYQVAVGQRLVLGIGSMTATLDIDRVGDDGVSIRVEGAAVVSPSGGIDLEAGCVEHTVLLDEGESVELGTCTLDGGTFWTVTTGG